MNFMLLVNLI
uniref:Uncharacterized protein n=1 Tax=Rhizophora mucronata TaxID=61149 RepID=A0A2P2KG13_RHIMU